jgi:hypothetical protein
MRRIPSPKRHGFRDNESVSPRPDRQKVSLSDSPLTADHGLEIKV